MTPCELTVHLDASIERAERYESKLGAGGEPIIEVGGFCGLKTRHLFNNLCSVPGINYLEVGVLHGATLLSAAYGNDGRFVGIDSFCQDFGGTDPAATRGNIAKWGHGQVELIEEDCWEANPMPFFDILYYDGGHSREETARAFVHFLPIMASAFLLIVDDAGWPDVYAGIGDGIKMTAARCEVWRQHGVGIEGDAAGYWNGVWAGVFAR